MADHEEHGDQHGDGGGHKKHAGGHGGHGGGGHEEAHEGAPEWLISFADNVALLMGFFVILLAMNMKAPTAGGIGGVDGPHTPPPTKAWLDAVIAIRNSFHSPIDMKSNDPSEKLLRDRKLELERELRGESVVPGPEGEKHSVQAIKPSDWVKPTATVPFEFGVSEVAKNEEDIVRAAAKAIAGKLNIMIEVRGHVSARETQRSQEKGMKLSYDRALAVAKLMAEAGVPWEHMRIVACSDASPRKSRPDNFAEHKTNQRVELVVIEEAPEPDQFLENATEQEHQ